jgi:hypothetical protein
MEKLIGILYVVLFLAHWLILVIILWDILRLGFSNENGYGHLKKIIVLSLVNLIIWYSIAFCHSTECYDNLEGNLMRFTFPLIRGTLVKLTLFGKSSSFHGTMIDVLKYFVSNEFLDFLLCFIVNILHKILRKINII